MTFIVRISEHPVHIIQAILTEIKVKSCNAFYARKLCVFLSIYNHF